MAVRSLDAPRLDPRRPYKPLDVGNGLLAASVAPDGRVLLITRAAADVGVVALSSAAPFPDALRRDPRSVRAYRERLAAPDAPGLGLVPGSGWTVVAIRLAYGAVPVSWLRCGPLHARVVSWAPRQPRAPALVQAWRLRHDGARGPGPPLRLRGTLNLGRAALTQLTEGGVLPLPEATARVAVRDGIVTATTDGTRIAAAIVGAALEDQSPLTGPAPLDLDLPSGVALRPGERRDLLLAWALDDGPDRARRRAEEVASAAHPPSPAPSPGPTRRHPAGTSAAPALVRRALRYGRDCCAVDAAGGICLLTDHQILPLSWTRDAYYLATALDDPEVLEGHLRWLFDVAQRTDGWWGRAYLPNGLPKDLAFQLDQQCYPLLEAADAAAAGVPVGRYARPVRELLTRLRERRTDGALITTDETPADDPLPLPYHFSSHVLLVHTLRRLAAVAGALDLNAADAAALRAWADTLTAEVRARFTVDDGSGTPLFAYAVGSGGDHLRYHDANDLPTAFAPAWGFCDSDDPVWTATMRFAFSNRNRGYAPGAVGGLGSLHTPGAWTLGDVQEYAVARQLREARRAAAVLARLAATACWDDALPEARDPDSGAVRSRHWFAWPGAALVYALRLLG